MSLGSGDDDNAVVAVNVSGVNLLLYEFELVGVLTYHSEPFDGKVNDLTDFHLPHNVFKSTRLIIHN